MTAKNLPRRTSPAAPRRAGIALVLALLCPWTQAGAGQVAWLWDEALLPAWSWQEAAILDRHILLSGDNILTRPRMRQPALAPSTRRTPVVHVEVSTVNPPRDIETSRAAILQAMRAAAGASTSGWVQLDMEARPSQRAFYRSLVGQIRAELPARIRLSVTALAWWCRSPAWLDDLPADEVVPMFFRMGKDNASLRALIEHTPEQLHPRCRSDSAGFSPQEAFPPQVLARYPNTYWFDRHAWRRTAASPSPLPLSRNMP